jgi:hypothetical protein
VLDQLHYSLELYDVEFQIQIPDQYVAGSLSIGCFRSPNSRVPAGAVMRKCYCGGHHVDAAVLNSWFPAGSVPDHRVVFRESRSGDAPDEEELAVLADG